MSRSSLYVTQKSAFWRLCRIDNNLCQAPLVKVSRGGVGEYFIVKYVRGYAVFWTSWGIVIGYAVYAVFMPCFGTA